SSQTAWVRLSEEALIQMDQPGPWNLESVLQTMGSLEGAEGISKLTELQQLYSLLPESPWKQQALSALAAKLQAMKK
ncbi:MAG TPA: hypothetical protein PKA06_15720, partial [Gemmatales bacterium]|nr:hypothetical protein [Gemmatales bacterium]